MKIGFTYNSKTDWVLSANDPLDANAELDKPKTIESIIKAFEWGGHQVKRIGNVDNLLAQLDDLDVDIVFNICEGFRGRNRESQVPILLEMRGIPFVGSDALTLGITLDKAVAKKCFIADGLPTPSFALMHKVSDCDAIGHLRFPLIVKTCHEGTSKGLTDQSRVETPERLRQQVEYIIRTYRQPALVEEFISGTEFTVPVLGNDQPQAMPVAQVCMDGSTDLGDKFYTFARVCSPNLRYVCPAKLSREAAKEIQNLAVRAYQSVGCRDFGRIDFRVDRQGQPYILEINPLPSLDGEDVFNIFPKLLGSSYNAVLNQIIDFACHRYGLKSSEKATAISHPQERR